MESIKSNYLYNTALQILMLIVPLVTTPYLSRVIGAEGIGTYSYYYAVVSYYMMFVKLGIDNYGNREIAEHRNNQNELKQSFSQLVYLQFFLGFIVIIFYLIYTKWFCADKKYTFLFILTLLATILDINWFLYGMEKFKIISIRNAIIKFISTLLIFIFIKQENHIFLYCVILNISNLICQLITWPLVLKETKFVSVSFKSILKHIKPNMILFMSLISVSIFKTMDKVMLGLMTFGKLEVGFYESSERIIHIPSILVVSLGTVMMPRITNMIASNDENYKNNIFISMIFSMMIASSMSFGIMGVAREFVPIYYGQGFEKCIVLYLILLPCCLFMAFATVIRTQYLLPNHMDKTLLFASISGAIVNLIINSLLIPVCGSIGAAIATLISEIVVCIWQVLAVYKELNIKKYFFYSIQFVFLGFMMFSCLFYLNLSHIHNIVIQIIFKILFGIIIYSVGSIIIFKIAIRRNDEEMIDINNKIISTFYKIM
ncbi:MAG: oligosaccharide flippase family protein [Spirochaetia bacterium]|nr:oligosaccharide flippase family protein [Spirochaetia bacterium]